jgi:hypothetical protein
MDEEIEKELERIRNLSFDEMMAEGLIIPARNPDRIFTLPKGKIKKGKIKKGKPLSEILIAERRSARY